MLMMKIYIVSDVDEIPNLKLFKYKNKISYLFKKCSTINLIFNNPILNG